jgi:UDP-galactopyranose mutase
VNTDYIVVGSGFTGSVVARKLADAGRRVEIWEKREHIGGNAFDEVDAHGILVHRYGPHIFHSNDEEVVRYLSRFTEWRPYEHRVLSELNGKRYPFPVNRNTLNQLYGLTLDEAGAASFLEQMRESRFPIESSEDLLLNSVGRDLYEKFFLNYTKKQWGLEPAQLEASVAARIPVRVNTDDRYFTDTFQGIPRHGYAKMFNTMLDHPYIHVRLNTNFTRCDAKTRRKAGKWIVYTGPVDAWFAHCHGPLPWRALRFEHEHLPGMARYQEVATLNYPNEHAYTRVTEFKHLTGQTHQGTSIVREYPTAEGEPCYPVPSAANKGLFRQYQVLLVKERDVIFVGRLAEYRYYNMDQAVRAALDAAEKLLA